MSKITGTLKAGRPKKAEEEKTKRSQIRVHSDTADRFRNFIMLNDIVSLDDGLILLLDEVDNLAKYRRSQEPTLQLSINPFQPSTSTPLREKIVSQPPAISPIIEMDVEMENYDLNSDLDDEEVEGLKSLIIEGDDTKCFDRTIDDGDFQYEFDEEEQIELPTAAQEKETKPEAVSAKANKALKQLSKATDLDYSNARRLLVKGYEKNFSQDAKTELEIIRDRRYICEESQLIQLLGEKCHVIDCTERIHIDSTKQVGCICEIKWICGIGHKGFWQSGKKLNHTSNPKISFYATNTLFASSNILSGNLWSKISLFAKALNLACISESLYYKIQRSICFEVIEKCWDEMQCQMFDTLKKSREHVVICGDCQNDSPGNSAEYGTYTFVDQQCGYALHLEVVDKRQVGLKSSNMEKAGFVRSVCNLFNKDIPIKEIVTDQNLQIIALIKKAKENPASAIEDAQIVLSLFNDWETFPAYKIVDLNIVEHQLDIWHKAKNIGKAVFALVVQKAPKSEKDEKQKLIKWIPEIKNHFWFCAETCKGDARLMKEKWLLSLQHLTGLHEWSTGKCEHGPDDISDKEPLDHHSKTFDLLRSQVIGDKKFLDSFHYFKNFRHTGLLESFHNVTLAYTPKRVVFDYNTMEARKKMAAIDHNHHVHRKVIRDYGDVPRIEKRWSKRADDWILYFIKEKKTYDYLEHMQAQMLKLRMFCDSAITRPKSRSGLHPEQVAPNIAREQKSLPEVLEKFESRFVKKS